MLRRIYIDNYRCLVNFELRPSSLNLFFGENGTGKTSVFHALMAVRGLIMQGLSVADLFVLARTRWESREIIRVEFEAEFGGSVFGYSLQVHAPVNPSLRPTIHAEMVTVDGDVLYSFSDGHVQLYDEAGAVGPRFPYRAETSYLTNIERQGTKLSRFRDFLDSLVVLQVNPWVFAPFARETTPFLNVSGANFLAWYRYLNDEHPTVRNRVEEKLREIIPGLENIVIQSVGDAKTFVAKCRSPQGTSYDLFLGDLSDGQRTLAVLYSVLRLLEERPASILCVDEPGNFVALPEIQPWLQEVRDWVNERGGQAFLVSHHPEVIDYLAMDGAFRFERPDGTLARVSKFEPTDATGLRASELLARGA